MPPRPKVRGFLPAGAAWSPTTPRDRDLVRACAQNPAIQGMDNCSPAMEFLGDHCQQVGSGWQCVGPDGAAYPLESFLANAYGGPSQPSTPSTPLPPVPAPTPAPTPVPVDTRLHPNDLELAQLRVQVRSQAQTITYLQIVAGATIIGVPLVTWLIASASRRRY